MTLFQWQDYLEKMGEVSKIVYGGEKSKGTKDNTGDRFRRLREIARKNKGRKRDKIISPVLKRRWAEKGVK